MFEKASRLKIRFDFRGLISVEDLWDLPLETLDTLFKGYNARATTSKQESLLDTKSVEDEILDLKIEIIRHVVTVKLAEREARKAEVERKARKEKLLEVLDEKQNAALYDLDPAKLQEMIAELE